MKNFQNYLSQQKFLIADESSASRIGIARALSELGVNNTQMSLTDSYEWAKELLNRERFTVLICEHDLSRLCGLDLMEFLHKKELVVIVTKNQSEAAAAAAAERNVDVFLTKPFSIEKFQAAVIRAVGRRLGIGIAPAKLNSRRNSSVEKQIQKAGASHSQVESQEQDSYRTLLAMYEELIKQDKKTEAYPILRRLVIHHPLNPDRLIQVLRLAIQTRSFADVEDFHLRFLKVENKSEPLIRHMSAALVMAGKHFVAAGKTEEALGVFRKAALTSAKRPSILREIILALVEKNLIQEADGFLTQFAPHQRGTTEYLTLDYLLLSKLRPLHVVLQKGRELIRAGHHEPLIYLTLIRACVQAGYADEAETLVQEAARHWPGKGADYHALLQPSAR